MKKTLIAAALICVAVICNGQGYSTVRPNPFGGGYNVYSYGGNGFNYSTTQIRPNPFGGGYNGYTTYSNGRGGYTTQIRPNLFGGGYNIYYGR